MIHIDEGTVAKIVICKDDPEQLACGVNTCPFHRVANITGLVQPAEDICDLPGEGGNILFMNCEANVRAQFQRYYKVRGVTNLSLRRLPKCLNAKPPQIE